MHLILSKSVSNHWEKLQQCSKPLSCLKTSTSASVSAPVGHITWTNCIRRKIDTRYKQRKQKHPIWWHVHGKPQRNWRGPIHLYQSLKLATDRCIRSEDFVNPLHWWSHRWFDLTLRLDLIEDCPVSICQKLGVSFIPLALLAAYVQDCWTGLRSISTSRNPCEGSKSAAVPVTSMRLWQHCLH